MADTGRPGKPDVYEARQALMQTASMLGEPDMADYHARRAAQFPDLPWDERVCGWRVGTRPDGRAVWVAPFLFTAGIILGPPDSLDYDDRWCYHSPATAILAALQWIHGQDEAPSGWHRRPSANEVRSPESWASQGKRV